MVNIIIIFFLGGTGCRHHLASRRCTGIVNPLVTIINTPLVVLFWSGFNFQILMLWLHGEILNMKAMEGFRGDGLDNIHLILKGVCVLK